MSETAPDALLAELIADARLAAAYGQRTGRLRDYELISAIAAVEKTPVPQWSDQAVVALQAAMNRAIQAFHPTTLADIKGEWVPFAPERRFRMDHFGFVLFSLLLMFCAGLATFEYNRGVSLANGIEELQKEDPRAAGGAIVRQLRAVSAPPMGTTNVSITTADEPHFILVDKLHAIDNRMRFYDRDFKTFLAEHPLPHEFIGDFLRRLIGLSPKPETAERVESILSVDFNTLPPSNECQTGPTYTYAGAKQPSGFVVMLTDAAASALELYCTERLAFLPFEIPDYGPFVSALRRWIDFWGLWYLPALYGAFGATIYYMRRILDPTIPDPTFIKILHRVALGAFAGVIITWFWAPNNQLLTGFTSIGLTLFTAAFLIGFCVDVLFAALDRLVTRMLEIAKGVDTRPTPPATPTVIPAVPVVIKE